MLGIFSRDEFDWNNGFDWNRILEKRKKIIIRD